MDGFTIGEVIGDQAYLHLFFGVGVAKGVEATPTPTPTPLHLNTPFFLNTPKITPI